MITLVVALLLPEADAFFRRRRRRRKKGGKGGKAAAAKKTPNVCLQAKGTPALLDAPEKGKALGNAAAGEQFQQTHDGMQVI